LNKIISLSLILISFLLHANSDDKEIAFSFKKQNKKVSTKYVANSIDIKYSKTNKNHIPIADIRKINVELTKINNEFYGPKKGHLPDVYSLAQLEKLPKHTYFNKSALNAISKAIVSYYNKRGYYGVIVSVDTNEISKYGNDIRRSQNKITFVIKAAQIKSISTLAQNQKGEKEKNSKKHLRIINKAPIKISEDNPYFFEKDKLDDYLFYLNRSPSRRVDANIRPMLDEDVGLEFVINEARPWIFWFNVSNTGAKETEQIIETVGYVNNRFLFGDDILRLFYSTDGFQNVHAFYFSYLSPFLNLHRVKYGIETGYNRFSSSELGLIAQKFFGEQIPVAGKFVITVFQHKNFFIDLVPSCEFRQIHVKNPTNIFDEEQEITTQNFLFPKISLELEKYQRDLHFLFAVALEMCPQVTMGSDRTDLDLLGRIATSKEWYTLYWDLLFSTYVDNLIIRQKAKTYVHELAFRIRGQYSFDYRIIAQKKAVLGGFNTIRGYPQSILSGDSSYVTTFEYLFHIPRLLSPSKRKPGNFLGSKFRFRPEHKGGPINWDLIVRAFLDAGRVLNYQRTGYEIDATLVGMGMGIELVIKDNFIARWDWGSRLKAVPSLGLNAGSKRSYFTITMAF
jgi:hypothetical protein